VAQHLVWIRHGPCGDRQRVSVLLTSVLGAQLKGPAVENRMAYDPFVRGPSPVGVRSGQATDATRNDRQLPFEVWYPAAPRYGGLDLSLPTQDSFTLLPHTPPLRQAAVRDAPVEAGRYPLLLFSHTSYGHRRQSSFLCTHLASHGYVVAAADHTGNSFADQVDRVRAGVTFTPEEREAYIQRIIADRVPDLRFLLDAMLGGVAGEVSDQIDGQRIGLLGWSFGGWAVLATPEVDERVRGVVVLAPAGNSKPLPGIIPATLTFAWKREVPILYLAAERDRSTPLPGIVELYERTPSSKTMLILCHADHDHFADHIEVELCPRPHARLFTRGFALAHLDAALKESPPAKHFMARDPAAAVRERGVDALAYVPGMADSST
jgi:dienelactone hydrolase